MLVVVALAALVAAAPEPSRVAAARAKRMPEMKALFAAAHVAYPPEQLLVRAFKKDAVVELWASGARDGPLTLVRSFAVCASSGALGPKVKQGDFQVPEGFYTLDKLNPFSRFHLALHVDYPNAADRARGRRENVADLGGEIMVHGNCVTIGCIPLEDDPIELLYLVVLDFENAGGSRPPIHIFPTRLDDAGLAALDETGATDDVKRFWRDQLAPGYRAFEKTRRIPHVTVDAHGAYTVR